MGGTYAGSRAGERAGELVGMPLGALLGSGAGGLAGGGKGALLGALVGALAGKLSGPAAGRTLGGMTGYHQATKDRPEKMAMVPSIPTIGSTPVQAAPAVKAVSMVPNIPAIKQALLLQFISSFFEKAAASLTADQRAAIPKKDFVFQAKAKNPEAKKKSGNYPIEDIKHGRAALSLGARHLSPERYATLKAKVYARYPELNKRKEA